MSALWLCFQDEPGTCLPAGLQGGLQNPVSREEGQMIQDVCMLLVYEKIWKHYEATQGDRNEMTGQL